VDSLVTPTPIAEGGARPLTGTRPVSLPGTSKATTTAWTSSEAAASRPTEACSTSCAKAATTGSRNAEAAAGLSSASTALGSAVGKGDVCTCLTGAAEPVRIHHPHVRSRVGLCSLGHPRAQAA
jgi:hypothetical protein